MSDSRSQNQVKEGKKMKKHSKNNVKAEVNNNVSIQDVLKTQYSCAMFEENIVQDHVVTVDMSKAILCDYMKMTRIAMFRLLVKKDASFDVIARHDFLFYRDTNDRSKSRKQDKQDDLLAYCRSNRTRKQLADVLKETAIVAYLNSKHNVKTYLTVDQYIKTVR
jgi:hypothetical protein